MEKLESAIQITLNVEERELTMEERRYNRVQNCLGQGHNCEKDFEVALRKLEKFSQLGRRHKYCTCTDDICGITE